MESTVKYEDLDKLELISVIKNLENNLPNKQIAQLIPINWKNLNLSKN